MGTPDFACHALQKLLAENKNVIAVYTKDPKEAGRGQKINKSPVHILAENNNIPVLIPRSLKSEEELEIFKNLKADLVIVAAYGLIIPQEFLSTALFINIHGSLLPRWRGAAPIQRAILAGDKVTGITIMKMEAGLDTGGMILKEEVKINDNMNASELHDILAKIGANLLINAIEQIAENKYIVVKQDDSLACYAKKIDKKEAEINFDNKVEDIYNLIRGFNPYPGAWFKFRGERIKILKAAYEKYTSNLAHNVTGQVIDECLTIAAKDGIIKPEIIQREGKKIMAIEDFLKGYKL